MAVKLLTHIEKQDNLKAMKNGNFSWHKKEMKGGDVN